MNTKDKLATLYLLSQNSLYSHQRIFQKEIKTANSILYEVYSLLQIYNWQLVKQCELKYLNKLWTDLKSNILTVFLNTSIITITTPHYVTPLKMPVCLKVAKFKGHFNLLSKSQKI